ncbi:MAG: cyanophycinase, partial [Pseudomonadota bacterium]
DAASETGPFVIVPSASGQPAQSANAVREILIRYGVASERIEIAKLAVRDDRSTPGVDEADWQANADDPETVDLLNRAAAIWFTGGDQSRTTRLLLSAQAQPTPALTAIRRARAKGASIGGTSAGAAIMSDPMITQGDTLPTLTGSDMGERLEMGPGLDFFEPGLVDQHFGERARLGRLAMALMQLPEPDARLGFGIDEDTALIASPKGPLSVKGNSYVTVLDARQAKLETLPTGAAKITNLTVHLIASGDVLASETLALAPANWKAATIGNEYVDTPAPGGGGMAVPGQSLADVIGEGLIDNKQSQRIERISFDGNGDGVAYVFTQLPASRGYWGRGPDGEGRYAIANVRFDIVPVRLSIETLK